MLGLISVYRALGGGWELRGDQDVVSDEVKAEMERRTDWGRMLEIAQHLPKRRRRGGTMTFRSGATRGWTRRAAPRRSLLAAGCHRAETTAEVAPAVTVSRPVEEPVIEYTELTGTVAASRTVQPHGPRVRGSSSRSTSRTATS